MKINGFARGAILAIALMMMATFAPAAQPARAETKARDITAQCQYKVSEGKKGALTDKSVRTGWTYSAANAMVGVAIPENASLMMLYWDHNPSGLEIEEYDANQSLLRSYGLDSLFPAVEMPVPLLPDTRVVFMRMTAPEQKLVEIKVYSEGDLSDAVQAWRAPVQKADLMVVSTHQDDELIFFGGTIPYYAVAKKVPTVVVYMANCGRVRRQEALNGLWAMGVRDYPEFINLRDKRVKTVNEGLELWGGTENILNELVWRIRRYRPEVIVTHDFDGEYGHNQHKITAAAMQYAIDAAADPQRFPNSADAYGAWQVKKLYIHLYEKNQVYMDWQTKLDELGGISPLLAAQVGYAEHPSQHEYYQVTAGGKYDNAKFGLYSTTVGNDTGKNDFFENIPSVQALYAPTPEPTAVPAATVEPTPQPQQDPVPPAAETVKESSGGGWGLWLGASAAVIAAAGGGAVLWARQQARRRRRRRRRSSGRRRA